MADKPTSQSGNIYSLKASTLKGYKDVGEAQEKFFDEGRTTLTTLGETLSQKIDNIQRVQEFDNAMNFIYDNGGDTFSAENKTQLREYIEKDRDSLINSLTVGTGEIDKEAAEAAEGNLDQIAKGMAAWDVAKKETGLIGVDENLGFSSAINPLEEHVMKQVQTNKAALNISEDGTVTFDVTMPDGSVINVNKNQYEALVTKNMLPKEFMADQADRNVNLLEQGNNASAAIDITTPSGMQKYNDLKKQNEADIDSGKASVQQILLDKNVVAGVPGTMFDAIVSNANPAVRDFKFPVSKAKGAAEDKNNDGFISMADFEDGDYEKLVVEMLRPENAEVTKSIIAEAMTLNNIQQFNKGFADKQAGSAANQNSSAQSEDSTILEPQDQGSEAADLINEALSENAIEPDEPQRGDLLPDGTFKQIDLNINPEGETSTPGGSRTVATQKPIKATFEQVLNKLTNVVYEGDNITELQRRFERQARSNGMSQVDIDKLFRFGGPAIITKLPSGKFRVRLRTSADANLPRQRPTGEPVE
tara:strand:- start:555 stop:2150 length:1596 start_codon:yes stop_codon:yes gene_type:complete